MIFLVIDYALRFARCEYLGEGGVPVQHCTLGAPEPSQVQAVELDTALVVLCMGSDAAYAA